MEKEIKNYVGKINDRNLQRKRESGITTYALYSVLIIIAYKVAEQYPLIPFKTNFWDVMYIFTCSVNIFLSLIFIYSTYELSLGYSSPIRLILNSTKNDSLLETLLVWVILFIIPIALNGLTFFKQWKSHNNVYWFFLVIGSVHLIVVVLALAAQIKENKKTPAHKVFNGTGNKGTDKNFESVAFYIAGLIIISFSIYHAFSFETKIIKSPTIIYCALLYSIPLVIIKIMDLRRQDNFTTALENLEYEIHVSGLSDEVIRERLQEKYMGFFVPSWIEYNKKHLNTFLENIKRRKGKIELLKETLVNIDPKEIGDKKEEIEKEISKLNTEVNFFLADKLDEIEKILNDNRNKLEQTDRLELSKLWKLFDSYLVEHKYNYSMLSKFEK